MTLKELIDWANLQIDRHPGIESFRLTADCDAEGHLHVNDAIVDDEDIILICDAPNGGDYDIFDDVGDEDNL